MASIYPHGDGWRAQLCVGRVRESASFSEKFEAEAWAKRRETELGILKRVVVSARRTASNKHIFLERSGIYTESEIVGTSMPLPETSGIYFLIKGDAVVYVGQSVNVHARIRDHLSSKCFDRINVIECRIDELNKLESQYIRRFKPILNIVGKSGPDAFDMEMGLLCQAS